MPELPEVETERGRLAAAVQGKRIASARIDDARLTRPDDPQLIGGALSGDRIVAVERRGKYIVVRLDEKQAERQLAVKNGPEPLGRGFTTRFLADRLAGRTAPLKAVVLDQRTVAGLGNIYADEALWHARLNPLRAAGSLSADEIAALRDGIRKALRLGIKRQGADLGDGAYAGGSMQDEFRAYGRTGEPCDRCGTPIVKTRAGGRGTWYCPTCQAASSSASRPSRSRRQSSV